MTTVATASGVGSWPGTDIRETLRVVRDTLGGLGAGAGAQGLPYLPELPDRGPGADLVGRGAALLAELPVDLQPAGWRLTDRPGRDQGRAEAFLRQDLDELAEAFDGWAGPLKVQAAGPWTLASSVWLPRGERVISDEGAARDLVDSLAEGVAQHLDAVRRLVPGAELVLQLDEPSLPAALAGRLPTASGYGLVRALDPQTALDGLNRVLAAAVGSATVVHSCAPGIPLPLLRRTGAALSLDTALLGPRGWEGVAVAVEEGTAVYAGCVPTQGALPSALEVADALTARWRDLGMPVETLAALTVTPACGLAALTPAQALSVQRVCVETARELTERATS